MNSTSDSQAATVCMTKRARETQSDEQLQTSMTVVSICTQRLFPLPTAPCAAHLYLLFSPASLTPMLWLLIDTVVLE